MSTKDLNTKEDFEAYLKEIRIEYSFSCFKENDGEACYLLGEWYTSQKMITEAIAQFKHTCLNYKHPRGCMKYGISLINGEEVGGETNIEKAIHYTKLSCDSGEKVGCFRNAQILMWEKRYPEALQQHIKYCNMDDYFSHNSCYKAGSILKQSQEVTGVPQDLESAFQYFMKACSLGNAIGCHELSLAYAKGRGVAKNPKLAEEFKKKAEAMPISENSVI